MSESSLCDICGVNVPDLGRHYKSQQHVKALGLAKLLKRKNWDPAKASAAEHAAIDYLFRAPIPRTKTRKTVD